MTLTVYHPAIVNPNIGKFSKEYVRFLILRFQIFNDHNCYNILMINAKNFGPVDLDV